MRFIYIFYILFIIFFLKSLWTYPFFLYELIRNKKNKIISFPNLNFNSLIRLTECPVLNKSINGFKL